MALAIGESVLEVFATAILAYPATRILEGIEWKDWQLKACLLANILLQISASLFGSLFATLFGPISVVGPVFFAAQLLANLLIFWVVLGLETFSRAMQVGICMIVISVILLIVNGPGTQNYDDQAFDDFISRIESVLWGIALMVGVIATGVWFIVPSFDFHKQPRRWLQFAVLLIARSSAFSLNLTTGKTMVLHLSRAWLIANIVVRILFGGIYTRAIVVQSTADSQRTLIPVNTVAIVFVNALTGIIIWEDWPVVSSWITNVSVLLLMALGCKLLLGDLGLLRESTSTPRTEQFTRQNTSYRAMTKNILTAMHSDISNKEDHKAMTVSSIEVVRDDIIEPTDTTLNVIQTDKTPSSHYLFPSLERSVEICEADLRVSSDDTEPSNEPAESLRAQHSLPASGITVKKSFGLVSSANPMESRDDISLIGETNVGISEKSTVPFSTVAPRIKQRARISRGQSKLLEKEDQIQTKKVDTAEGNQCSESHKIGFNPKSVVKIDSPQMGRRACEKRKKWKDRLARKKASKSACSSMGFLGDNLELDECPPNEIGQGEDQPEVSINPEHTVIQGVPPNKSKKWKDRLAAKKKERNSLSANDTGALKLFTPTSSLKSNVEPSAGTVDIVLLEEQTAVSASIESKLSGDTPSPQTRSWNKTKKWKDRLAKKRNLKCAVLRGDDKSEATQMLPKFESVVSYPVPIATSTISPEQGPSTSSCVTADNGVGKSGSNSDATKSGAIIKDLQNIMESSPRSENIDCIELVNDGSCQLGLITDQTKPSCTTLIQGDLQNSLKAFVEILGQSLTLPTDDESVCTEVMIDQQTIEQDQQTMDAGPDASYIDFAGDDFEEDS